MDWERSQKHMRKDGIVAVTVMGMTECGGSEINLIPIRTVSYAA